MDTLKLYSIQLHLEPNQNGVYTVTSPDVPGLVTEGRTPEEILRHVEEALQALLQAWDEMGVQPPEKLRSISFDQPRMVEMLVSA